MPDTPSFRATAAARLLGGGLLAGLILGHWLFFRWSATLVAEIERRLAQLPGIEAAPASRCPIEEARDPALPGADRRDALSAMRALPARSVPYDRKVVAISEASSLHEALALFDSHRVSCALVHAAADRGDVVGLLDSSDVAVHLLHAQGASVAGCVQQSARRFSCVSGFSGMSEVLSLLCRGDRYVCVKTGDAHGIVSQGSVLRHLLSRQPGTDPGLDKTVGEAGLARGQILVATREESAARDAFHKMVAASLSSLPVVDESGVMRGLVSLSDFVRCLGGESAGSARASVDLEASVGDFVRVSRGRGAVGGKMPARPFSKIVQVAPADTLREALARMTSEDVHHLFLLDERGAPRGVVSSVDILRILCRG